jgi:hypothetical protein
MPWDLFSGSFVTVDVGVYSGGCKVVAAEEKDIS